VTNQKGRRRDLGLRFWEETRRQFVFLGEVGSVNLTKQEKRS
jgi:hypothetical protein